MQNFLIAGAKQLGLTLENDKANKLLDYLNILCKWNKIYNLCADATYKHMVSYHLLDSISVAGYIDGKFKKILDVGTGAGLPGIPLAIIDPACNVTLLDSKAKKVAFLKHAVDYLTLKNISIVLSRIENYLNFSNNNNIINPNNSSYSNCGNASGDILFDLIISRAAVANLTKFVQLTARLCAQDGCFIAMKSDPSDYKIGSVVWDDYKIIDLKVCKIPGIIANRSLVVIGRTNNKSHITRPS